MDAVTLLRRAHDACLRVKPVGDQLLVQGPRRAEPLVRLLAAHKAEVMAALTERDDRAGAASRECHGAAEAGYWRDLFDERAAHRPGLRLLRAGYNEVGRVAWRLATFRDAVAGEALGRTGKIGDGLVLIEEAIDHAERTEERCAFAELLRVKGELLVGQGGSSAAAAAEDHFRRALDWARRHGALSWELRATTSLARLLRDQSRSADATALLQPVYDRFTEGFDTADLKTAKALLDALAEPVACG